MNLPVHPARRARTDEQKELRRRAILGAAASHFAEAGFESFSMATVGKLAGVAKGTLYLYFETREELLLALYLEKLESWEAALTDAIGEGADDLTFVSVYYESAYEDPTFLRLMSRLDSVIEHNVSMAKLVAAKRAMASIVNRVSGALAPGLELSVSQTFEAVTALASLLLGASQIDAGPQLEDASLPQDVREFAGAFSSQEIFIVNACRILSGIRVGNFRT